MVNCIICAQPHEHLWQGELSWYCVPCAAARVASSGVASQVMPGLFVGDADAAAAFKGMRLSVYCEPPTYGGDFAHIPILVMKPASRFDRSAGRASITQLDKAAWFIAASLCTLRRPLIVHCKGGVERSPLTLAWYLVRTKQYASFAAAYAHLKSVRPVVSERLYWLPNLADG